MKSSKVVKLASVPVALALVMAACGSDDDSSSSTDAPEATTAPEGTDGGAATAEGALAEVCPDPIVIQTDWFPEAEHGALYEMVGEGYTVDIEKKTVTGPLVASGEDTGIDIEVRTGGPAIGFSPVHSQMYADESIMIGYTSLDASATFYEDQPTIAVVAPLEKNPQIIMWDPETYPDATSIADLSNEGVTMNVFAGNAWMDVFVNEGTVEASLVDPSYDGSPGSLHRRERRDRSAGLRLGRAVHVRERVRGLGQAGRLRTDPRRRLRGLHAAARYPLRGSRDAVAVPRAVRADRPAGDDRLHRRARTGRTRSSSTP